MELKEYLESKLDNLAKRLNEIKLLKDNGKGLMVDRDELIILACSKTFYLQLLDLVKQGYFK